MKKNLSMKRALLIGALFMLPILGFAQDSLWSKKIEVNLTGSYAASANTIQSTQFISGATFKKDKWKISLSPQYVYTAVDNKTSQSDFQTRNQIKHGADYSAFLFHSYQTSATRDISNRNFIGFGGETKKFGSKNVKANLSYAFLLDRTMYIGGISKDSLFITQRHSLRTQIEASSNKVSFFCEGYFQPAVKDVANYIFVSTTKLNYKVTKNISLSLTGTYNYEAFTVNKTPKQLYSIGAGVGYKFTD
jgi:hypothetical protein